MDKLTDERYKRAQNTTDPEELEKLAVDIDGMVRGEVAKNPNTPEFVLEKLAEDWRTPDGYGVSGSSSRSEVAQNECAPISMLEKFAVEDDEMLRAAVAKNPNTPVSLMEKLLDDKDEYVRKQLARNIKTPASLLEKMAKDENDGVCEAAKENPNFTV